MRDTPALAPLQRGARPLFGAFAAMVFVGASWGANLPVSKVMLRHFDVIPMAALRTVAAVVTLALLLWLVEGRRALRIGLGFGRFLGLGFIMSAFFAVYALGLYWSNPITAATVQVAGPLIAALTVRLVAGLRFDPGFGVALALSVLGGGILSSSNLFGAGHLTFGGGEIVVLFSSVLWTLYALKAQAWFERGESQLHRAFVASLSSMIWLGLGTLVMVPTGLARSPLGVGDAWVWTQLLVVAALASGLGSFAFNIGASRLSVAVASLWVNLVPFFAVLWSMAYGFMPNAYQIGGGLVALSGVVYMQWRKLAATRKA
jgi:drug/metabolite transporter (DMT)-like permease